MELDKNTKITLCNDNKYRWIYELDMLKNPVIFKTVVAVIGIGFGVTFLFVAIADLIQGHFNFETIKVFVILFLVILVIGIIAYLLVAKMYDNKYIVVFEMDDKGINHIQEDKQADKGQILASIVALTGAINNNPTTAASGLLAYSKTQMYTEFSKVKKIIKNKKYNCIKLNETLNRNQIYCADEDFDFVYDYIKQRCK